ncbi:hypothetical protein LTR85_001479 [Meristemomyces frigidus]|nr:hypothetical protein LTR85_001479 [Meristemomyces frigidus]
MWTGKLPVKGRFRRNRPFNQNFVMGCILFCLPGIYLALTGLGAGGGRPSSQHVASLTNSILYGVYTFFGWCAGTILNYLKPRYTIAIGALGYPLYVGSLWYYDRIGVEAFPLFAGAFLGFTAALLWTSSGFIQFAYAEEKDKAKYITYQWVLTSAIVMDLLLIVDPKDVVRDDGRHIAIFKEPNLKEELSGVLAVMMDPKIIILLLPMYVGEVCLALTSSINSYYFNLRTRSLNNLLFQAIMIPAPIALAWVMDNPRIMSRRNRGLSGVAIVGTITMASTAGLLGWVMRNNIDRSLTSPAVDWTDSAFASGFVLYVLSGIVYACFQITVQWTLSALTNDPVLCARYAGAFKGTVSLGMCISFTIDAKSVSFQTQLVVDLVLYAAGLACLVYVIMVYVKDTNYFLESDVIVPAYAEEKALAQGDVQQTAVEEMRLREAVAEGKTGSVSVAPASSDLTL